MMGNWDDYTICPGCGYTARRMASCPLCGYENGLEPGRLLTVREILDGEHGPHTLADGSGAWQGVNLVAFLRSYERRRRGWRTYHINALVREQFAKGGS